jgi:hypothetical protein
MLIYKDVGLKSSRESMAILEHKHQHREGPREQMVGHADNSDQLIRL